MKWMGRSCRSLLARATVVAAALGFVLVLAAAVPGVSGAQGLASATSSPRTTPSAAAGTAGARPSVAPFFATQTALAPRLPAAPTATTGGGASSPSTPTVLPAFFATQTALAPRLPPSWSATPTAGQRPPVGPATAAPTSSPTPRPPAFPVGAGALAGRTVVLDAGHGGRDPGAVHHGVRESDVNLAVTRELRPLLEEAGARVVLTRDGDQAAAPGAALNAELQARVSVATRVGADLFVSIHANAHEDRDVQGAITFYGREAGFASGAQRPPRLVARSRQLAGAINRELTLATGEIDRGTRSANFWVLGGPRIPAVLVEVGFLTNAEEAARLATPSFQRFAAQGIAAGVARYLGTEEDAQFVADVTLGDGADVTAGEALVKTWRVRNTGATTWGPGYRLAFHDGDALGGPPSLPLALGAVAPGAEVDVSVSLVAGAEHAGRSVRGQWQLQSPDGSPFGDRLWVSVRAGAPVVVAPAPGAAPSGAPAPGAPARPAVLPLPTDRVAPLAHPEVTYAEATGHNLGFGFRRFFDAFGGLDLFGYPRTEEMQEGGFTVQYFQRARFEYHPEHAGTPYEVQLGLLGDLVTAPRRPFPAGGPFESAAQHRWYPETGHGVHYAFLTYFDARGGLDVFGFPISEELPERNDDGSGRAYTVQYFQRARFEYHPEHAGTPYEVQLGLLGDQRLQASGWLR